MTPRRWLLIASGVALLYVGQLITAYIVADTALPTQINSVILTILAVGFTLAGMSDVAGRSERRLYVHVSKEQAVVVELLREQVTRSELLAERLDQIHEVLAGLVALGSSHAEEVTKRVDDLAAQIEALAAEHARGNVGIHARIDELADELTQSPPPTALRRPQAGRSHPGA